MSPCVRVAASGDCTPAAITTPAIMASAIHAPANRTDWTIMCLFMVYGPFRRGRNNGGENCEDQQSNTNLPTDSLLECVSILTNQSAIDKIDGDEMRPHF